MKRYNISAMTLLETMVTVALFSLVMLAASQAVIRGMSVWGVSAKETAATWNLQQGMNACFMDLLRAKKIEAYGTGTDQTTYLDANYFTKIKIQMPVEYTKTGADGYENYYIVYYVGNLPQDPIEVKSLLRQLYSSGQLLDDPSDDQPVGDPRLLVRGISSEQWNTKIDDPDNGTITGFRVIRKEATSKEFTIYLRLAEILDTTSNKRRELISKVYVRNLKN